MPTPLLRITDGTVSVYLHGRSGFSLEDWTPRRAQLKDDGVWANSPLADGRRLRLYKRDNIVDTFALVASHQCFDDLVHDCQDLDRLLTKALDYHQSPWQTEPVWIEARGPDETNTRYALIHSYAFPQDDNPYAQPAFTNLARLGFLDMELVLEHGPWLELAPGQQRCLDISATQEYNSITYGRESTGVCAVLEGAEGCILAENGDVLYLEDGSGCIALEGGAAYGSPWPEVYVANKHTRANITNLHVVDGGVWGANLIATPFVAHDLLPAAPAVNDYIAAGCSVAIADSGPFCSLVFDLDDVSGGGTFTWEYSTGAGAWTAFAADQITDNTDNFNQGGVCSVHWIPQDNWVSATYGGVTAMWVRGRVSAGAPNTPSQQNRNVYTVAWPYITLAAAEMPGDITGLSHVAVYPKSPDSDTALAFDRMMLGLRSTSRGDTFSAYLNAAEEQNPSGVLVDLSANGTFTQRSEAPSGWLSRLAVAAAGSEEYVSFILNSEVYPTYRGTYHAFCRVRMGVGGPVDEVTAHLRIGSRVAGTFYQLWESSVYPAIQATSANEYYELLDLGRVTLPPTTPLQNYTALDVRVVITNDSAATAATVDVYDLILMPVDEWSGMFVEVAAGTEVTYEQRLDVDSIRDPRLYIRVQSMEAGNDNSIVPYQPQVNGPAIWQANAEQRLWFMGAISAAAGISSHQAICSGVWAWGVGRYQSMRGAR